MSTSTSRVDSVVSFVGLPGWTSTFIKELAACGNPSKAARRVGVAECTPYKHRRNRLDFAQAWETAIEQYHEQHPRPAWEEAFLCGLEECGDVTKAAASAGVSHTEVYRHRKDRPAFKEAWDAVARAYRRSVNVIWVEELPGDGKYTDVNGMVYSSVKVAKERHGCDRGTLHHYRFRDHPTLRRPYHWICLRKRVRTGIAKNDELVVFADTDLACVYPGSQPPQTTPHLEPYVVLVPELPRDGEYKHVDGVIYWSERRTTAHFSCSAKSTRYYCHRPHRKLNRPVRYLYLRCGGSQELYFAGPDTEQMYAAPPSQTEGHGEKPSAGYGARQGLIPTEPIAAKISIHEAATRSKISEDTWRGWIVKGYCQPLGRRLESHNGTITLTEFDAIIEVVFGSIPEQYVDENGVLWRSAEGARRAYYLPPGRQEPGTLLGNLHKRGSHILGRPLDARKAEYLDSIGRWQTDNYVYRDDDLAILYPARGKKRSVRKPLPTVEIGQRSIARLIEQLTERWANSNGVAFAEAAVAAEAAGIATNALTAAIENGDIKSNGQENGNLRIDATDFLRWLPDHVAENIEILAASGPAQVAEAVQITVTQAATLSGIARGTISRAAIKGEIINNGVPGRGRLLDGADFTRWHLDRTRKGERPETDAEVQAKFGRARAARS